MRSREGNSPRLSKRLLEKAGNGAFARYSSTKSAAANKIAFTKAMNATVR